MTDFISNTFYQLTSTAQRVAETESDRDKIRICSDYLKQIQSENDLDLATRFLVEGAFPAVSDQKVTIGSRTISTYAARFCEISYEKVFKPSKAAMGDAAETIEKLMHNIEAARHKRAPQYLSLYQIETVFNELSCISSRTGKQQILWDVWTKLTPVEIKYFIHILWQRPLPIGLDKKQMIEAIAEAFQKDAAQVQETYLISGSIGKTAVLSKTSSLSDVDFSLFHPRPLMYASSADIYAVNNLNTYFVEEKLDGIRCQAHISSTQISLFAAGTDDVTQAFSDVTSTFSAIEDCNLVLDGVICVFRNNKILSSQILKKRLKSNNLSQKLLEKYPAIFIAHDVLFYDGQSLFQQALTKRRSVLKNMLSTYNLPITNQFEAYNYDELEHFFERSVRRGNKGLILKKKNSIYQFGHRGTSWLKIKEKAGTLNGVIMYAHTGSGNRDNRYTSFTLGIRVQDDERYEEEFIPVGKIPNICLTQELEKLDEQIRSLTVEKYGPTLGLIPEIVVEAEFDDIQANKRTKANYRLHQPRFKAVRQDLGPGDVDTLKDVERMYQQKINRTRLKQDKNPSFLS